MTKICILKILLCTATFIGPVAFCKQQAEPPDPNSTGDLSKQLRSEIMKERISTIATDSESKTDTELERLILQIQSLNVPLPNHQPPKSKSLQNQPPQPQSNTANEHAFADPNTTAKQQSSGNDVPADILSAMDSPQNIIDSFATAESLFHAGRYEQACKFYQLAASSLDQNDPDRQWALFQSANSAAFTNHDLACDFYKKFLEQYPESAWAAPAKAKLELLTWQKQNAAEDFLNSIKNDPNGI